MHELVIRGATIIDGLGHDPLRADVAIAGGRIAAIGNVGNDAAKVVDADGFALMPGIIDIHTHHDAQVTRDPTQSPSPLWASRRSPLAIAASASCRRRPVCATRSFAISQ